MPHWIKSNGPLLVGIFLIIILPIFESKFPSAFQYIENWLSLSASLITILALFLAFWQWKKQLIANKKDNLSSKLINLLISLARIPQLRKKI